MALDDAARWLRCNERGVEQPVETPAVIEALVTAVHDLLRSHADSADSAGVARFSDEPDPHYSLIGSDEEQEGLITDEQLKRKILMCIEQEGPQSFRDLVAKCAVGQQRLEPMLATMGDLVRHNGRKGKASRHKITEAGRRLIDRALGRRRIVIGS